MQREKYSIHVREISLNIVQNSIDSVRKKDILKTGYRVYNKGNIGVAGVIGSPAGQAGEDKLWEKAGEALSLQVPYPCDVTRNKKEQMYFDCVLSSDEDLMHETEIILSDLKETQPGFSFSNKINRTRRLVELKNDAGLDLSHESTHLDFSLLVKDNGSSNILDLFTGYEGREYDREAFLGMTNSTCEAWRNRIDITDGKYPVVFFTSEMSYRTKLLESLHGMLYGSGSSLLSGKLGEKLFNDNFTVYQSRNPEDTVSLPFFDAEGTIPPDYRYSLIEKGVLKSPFTDKKTARKYDLPLTGAAAGEYDSVPDIGYRSIIVKPSAKTMKELLDGQGAVFAFIPMGGDFTPDGHFATPVHLAFWFDGEKLTGRLPELNLSSHLYDMFGKDFIGVSGDYFFPLGIDRTISMRMQVSKKE